MPTSMMLSHSELPKTPCSSITVPAVPSFKAMLSKPSVVPELVQVVTSSPSTKTSIVLTLISPLYSAGSTGNQGGVKRVTHSHTI